MVHVAQLMFYAVSTYFLNGPKLTRLSTPPWKHHIKNWISCIEDAIQIFYPTPKLKFVRVQKKADFSKNNYTPSFTRTSPAPCGRRSRIRDARSSLGTTKSNFDFSFCESTFEVMSTQSAPDLTGKSVGYAISDIFLFPNEPMACQILNLKKIVCRQQLWILHWTA